MAKSIIDERNGPAMEQALLISEHSHGVRDWLRDLTPFLGISEGSYWSEEQLSDLNKLCGYYDDGEIKDIEKILKKTVRGLMMIKEAQQRTWHLETGEALPRPGSLDS